MKQVRTIPLVFPASVKTEELLESLSASFQIDEVSHSANRETYYDTFDWRLYRRSMLLCRSASGVSLRRLNGTVVQGGQASGTDRLFWHDIENSALAERLHRVLEMRAALPVAELASGSRQLRLMNKDRKTVVRLTLYSDLSGAETDGPQIGDVAVIREVRGYDAEFRRCVECGHGLGLTDGTSESWFADRIFAGTRRQPLDYGGKFKVRLDRGCDIGEAVAKICRLLVDEMEANRAGIIDDIDSEFLHDFRIAVRRTRSLLALLKKDLPTVETKRFQAEFKWLGTATGPLRDIDVYLLKKESYLAMVPQTLHKGLRGFFKELEDRRAGELDELRRHLDSARYAELIRDWRDFLDNGDSPLFTSVRTGKCRTRVDTIIGKRFRQFLKSGDAIDELSGPERLHELRIRGKKLRYLLEFFRSFYDDASIERFLKQMRKLQDNLGAFNDLTVQQRLLKVRLDRLPARGKANLDYAAALGGLIAQLSADQIAVRNGFQLIYDKFSTPRTSAMLDAMLASNRGTSADKRSR